MIILDTNVISEMMRPAPNPQVVRWLEMEPLASLATTSISIAEIRYGLLRLPDGRRKVGLQNRFEEFVTVGFDQRVLPFDAKGAEAYAVTFRKCERQGRTMEAFDCMIAAIALSRNAVLATRNVSDFEFCDVQLLNPWDE